MKNIILRLRFWFFDCCLHRFDNPVKAQELDNYREVFFDDFSNGINWYVWHPSEAWGNIKDDNNQYIIWLAKQVTQSPQGLCLTTDLNSTISEPAVKSGQICLWKSVYQAFGRYRSLIKVPSGGVRYWFSKWLIGLECREELDVFELMDNDSRGFTITLHAIVEDQKQIVFSRHFRFSIDLSESFHLYEVDWQENCIAWYFDNIKLAEYRGKYIPTCKMGLIINNAVSRGFMPNSIPPSTLEQLFPATGIVKYVQIFERK